MNNVLQDTGDFRAPISKRVRDVLDPHNITEEQWRILVCLSDEPMISKDIAAKTSLLKPAVSRSAKKLEKRGFIFVTESGEDWRGKEHSLTPYAEQFVKSLYGEVKAAFKLTKEDLIRFGKIV